MEEIPGLAVDKMLGGPAVYYQPGPDVHMVYPCIVYTRDSDMTDKGDNLHYIVNNRYTVTIVDRDPDSQLPDIFLKKFPRCTPDRNFQSDNLYHYNFTLYN